MITGMRLWSVNLNGGWIGACSPQRQAFAQVEDLYVGVGCQVAVKRRLLSRLEDMSDCECVYCFS